MLTRAAWFAARWVVIGVAVYLLGLVLMRIQAVLLPLLIAVLLAALLAPLSSWLVDRGWSRWLATTTVLVVGLITVAAALTFVVVSFAQSVPELRQQLAGSIRTLRVWAVGGPLGLDRHQIHGLEQQAVSWISSNQQTLTSGALSTAVTAGGVLTGSILALFTLVFFLQQTRFLAFPRGRGLPNIGIVGSGMASSLLNTRSALGGVSISGHVQHDR